MSAERASIEPSRAGISTGADSTCSALTDIAPITNEPTMSHGRRLGVAIRGSRKMATSPPAVPNAAHSPASWLVQPASLRMATSHWPSPCT